MAKTDAAVSSMSMRKAASGKRLLRGCVSRILCSTDVATPVLRSLTACAIVGMAVIGFCVFSTGSGEFIGSTLSAIRYSPEKSLKPKQRQLPYLLTGSWRITFLAAFYYFTCWFTAVFAFSTTSLGSGAYDSAEAIPSPLSSAQSTMSFTILPLVLSVGLVGTSSQVKLAIGYAVFPGGLVIDTRKSAGIFTPAEAAVVLSKLALMNWPDEFFTLP